MGTSEADKAELLAWKAEAAATANSASSKEQLGSTDAPSVLGGDLTGSLWHSLHITDQAVGYHVQLLSAKLVSSAQTFANLAKDKKVRILELSSEEQVEAFKKQLQDGGVNGMLEAFQGLLKRAAAEEGDQAAPTVPDEPEPPADDAHEPDELELL